VVTDENGVKMRTSRSYLCTDADNTLWDTNGVFAEAQLAMLREIESATGLSAPDADDRGLEFLRRIDQRIAAAHPERLRYPPDLLVRGLALALAGDGPEEAAARATQECSAVPGEDVAIQHFREQLRVVPPLRPGVEKAIPAVAAAGVPIFVVTEERLPRCRELLDAHDLSSHVCDVISLHKTVEAFEALRRKLGNGRAVMVGDQVDRDIRFAGDAGFETIYFPSAFEPYWSSGYTLAADHQIISFEEVVALVLGGHRRLSRRPE
jgi:putative hydrolase of the HAD superfamily